ncbi:MAG: acyl-CoA dehydrogenase family protein [Acidimicrobiales bacterium]
MTQRAWIDALRYLIYANSMQLDRATSSTDADERLRHQELADLLIPLSKSLGTDVGCELTSLAVQVHGGMGFVEETGAAQHFRDIRIAPIYEGTNGIQAADLVGRKLAIRGGALVNEQLDECVATAAQPSPTSQASSASAQSCVGRGRPGARRPSGSITPRTTRPSWLAFRLRLHRLPGDLVPPGGGLTGRLRCRLGPRH